MSPSLDPAARRKTHLRGALYLAAGVSVFTLQDLVVKALSASYPLTEILTIRSAIAFLPLGAILLYSAGLGGLKTRRPGLMTVRGLCLFGSYTTYYLSIATLPLAEAVALFYSGPLFIVALSRPILGEPVSLQRWAVVIFGFLGVIAILKPGQQVIEPAALLGITSAAFYALAQILARKLGAETPAAGLTIYQNSANFLIAGLIGLIAGDGRFGGFDHASAEFFLRAWIWPTAFDFLLIAGTGFIAAAGMLLLAAAYRIAEPNAVAPFEYCSILWAIAWGYLLWGEVPDLFALVGLAMIVLAGLYVLRLERRGR